MATQTVDALVEGGKASAAPPLGPALGPLGVNIGKVVAEINKQTEAFKGMKVPVKVVVDTETKEFSISIGTPPAAQLIKTEAGLEKGSGRPNSEHVADLRIEQIIKIAKMKQSSLLGKNLKACVKEIIGTCNALGVKVEGVHAQQALRRVEQGEFDQKIASGKTELSAEELKELATERKALQAELEKKHAAQEKQAKDILDSLGGDIPKARKKMEESGIDETIIDKIAPKPAAAGAGDKKK
jgi:large subunit ribosomal protein L11